MRPVFYSGDVVLWCIALIYCEDRIIIGGKYENLYHCLYCQLCFMSCGSLFICQSIFVQYLGGYSDSGTFFGCVNYRLRESGLQDR